MKSFFRGFRQFFWIDFDLVIMLCNLCRLVTRKTRCETIGRTSQINAKTSMKSNLC